ncbi:pyocin knob domain-containing protein [Dryocola clanedunensis]|uniref:pyocin knob domain-containing protein n=1 Tax=Cedecea sulfonylureivorans TaxID=3051154 RepID=UPI001928E90B|nr:pyocin knob domain-containing protein [Cedecea sulfonylureivorans]
MTQVYYVYNSSRVWSRSQYSTGAWTPWAREYNTQNKPSASDVYAIAQDSCEVAGFANNNAANPYMRHKSSNAVVTLAPQSWVWATFQPKGSYTPAGQAYTKAESEARYVRNMQRGAATSPAKTSQYGANEAPTGCVLTRAWGDPSDDYGVLMTYRPLQIYLNGAWRTITG